MMRDGTREQRVPDEGAVTWASSMGAGIGGGCVVRIAVLASCGVRGLDRGVCPVAQQVRRVNKRRTGTPPEISLLR